MGEQFDDVIEAGTRGRKRVIGIVVLAVLVAVPVVGLVASDDAPPEMPEPVPQPIGSLTTVTAEPNILTPKVRVKGRTHLIDVVFPDGRRATVRYPAELRLDRLGVRPAQGGWLEGDEPEFRQLVAPYGGEVEVTKGGRPIRSMTGNVTLWPRQAGGEGGQVLLFAFGPWRLALYDRPLGLTFEQRMAWARNLRGRVTGDGYLVLSARRPLRLAGPGEAAGPQLWFGTSADRMVVLMPVPSCSRPIREPPVLAEPVSAAGHACRDGVYIGVTGPEEFVGKAVKGLRIRLE
ncbi:hypothetical protein [Thermoactinospora rubra]|uniref:hypothetical protein n=1 Tax=Thermoactinospora rubra TaxID=1088767 RepID=UPI000A10455A|nr:hypothetical protein [Thermoactinospora rubra]